MNNVSRSNSGNSTLQVRQNALWRGLPAALFAIIGLTALLFASDRNSKLETRYRRWAEDATKERVKLSQKIINDLQVAQSGQSNKTADELIPADDKRRKDYERISGSERLYYEKLISLNAEVPEYRYHFANACANSKDSNDRQRGLSLMETLAPHNQTGFPLAHLWWADYFSNLIQFKQLNPQVGAELVFNHADNCLRRQADDKNALMRKGQASIELGRNEDALEAFTKLFESDPFYFSTLVQINTRLNRSDANANVFRTAKGRIESRLGEDMSIDLWCKHWEALTSCMMGLKEFSEAATRLRQEIEIQTQKKDNSFGQVLLEQLLSKVLVAVQQTQNPNRLQFTPQDIELLSEAHRLDTKNQDVLQILTRITMSDDPAISDAARKVYDPTTDENASALVLNELGTVALAKKDYQKAVMYLENARAKQPNDISTLNNLAYIYLVSENRNAERSLKLVDEAIRKIPNPEVAQNYMTFFLDTKGTALKQLNRMPEAIAAFELALKDRPNNVKILNDLVECYEASNLSAEAYKDRLKRLNGN